MTVVEENVTEETLDKHETYIEHLEEQAEQMRPIMKTSIKEKKLLLIVIS